MNALPTATSHHCTACGKCCNSGPQLSLPELFHHQTRFIACLTLRRVKYVRADEVVGRFTASAADESAFSALASELLHPLPSHDHALLLAMQAFYDARESRCPALGSDNACLVHHDRKPRACAVAPLEAWLPDSLQHHVLHSRMQSADYLGTDCIRPGEDADGSRVITRKLKLVQPEARDTLAQRRADLRAEKRFWGDAVFAALARDLCADRAALTRIPTEGFVSIPPAPVLSVIAAASERCKARCLAFLSAQITLIEAVFRAPGRTPAAAAELAALHSTARALGASLARAPALERAPHAAAVEAWLGLSAA